MKLKIAIGLVLTLLLILAVTLFLAASKPRNGPYPSPNAVETLSLASKQMTPLPLDFDTTDDVTALKAYLDSNTEPLTLIDQAMDQESLFPLDKMESPDESLELTQTVRGPFRLLVAKARVAELEKRYDDAIETYLQMCTLSDKSARGGLLINCMVATACKGIAFDGLSRVAGHLSKEQRIEVERVAEAAAIDSIDRDAMLERERQYSKRFNGVFVTWQMGKLQAQTVNESLQTNASNQRRMAEQLLETLGDQSVSPNTKPNDS